MPVSERHSKLVYDALVAAGVEVVSALPETWSTSSAWPRTTPR